MVEPLLTSIRVQTLQRPVAPVSVHVAQLFDWLRVRFERRLWIERSGGSLEYAELLRERWPNALFILLVRDGRETRVPGEMGRRDMVIVEAIYASAAAGGKRLELKY